MKEKPILFSGAMIKAILEGRKTQTRRVFRLGRNATPGSANLKYHDFDLERGWPDPGTGGGGYLKAPFCHKEDGWQKNPEHDTVTRIYAPWHVGQKLWIRESFVYSAYGCGSLGNSIEVRYLVDGATRRIPDTGQVRLGWPNTDKSLVDIIREGRNRPSIHMPRWASRLTLEITEIRVQRLQEITSADAWAEGMLGNPDLGGDDWQQRGFHSIEVCRFHDLWNHLNAVRGFSWDANPWVWAISFRRVDA